MLKNILQMTMASFFLINTLFCMTSFETAMGPFYEKKEYRLSRIFQPFYEKYHYEKVKPSANPLIPKKIHHIWLGGEVPEKFKKIMQSWKEFHPDFEYFLWTDETIKTISLKNQNLFDKASNFGTKSDLLRYEILEQFGGIYVDVDFECIKSLEPLIFAHSFFTGIGGFDYINNAIIGSSSHHPLIQNIVMYVGATEEKNLSNPWYHTGPLFFTKQVARFVRKHPDQAIVYPICFFYPMPNTMRFDYRENKLSLEMLKPLFIEETFAVHYFAESWR